MNTDLLPRALRPSTLASRNASHPPQAAPAENPLLPRPPRSRRGFVSLGVVEIPVGDRRGGVAGLRTEETLIDRCTGRVVGKRYDDGVVAWETPLPQPQAPPIIQGVIRKRRANQGGDGEPSHRVIATVNLVKRGGRWYDIDEDGNRGGLL